MSNSKLELWEAYFRMCAIIIIISSVFLMVSCEQQNQDKQVLIANIEKEKAVEVVQEVGKVVKAVIEAGRGV